jgi:hypothetical protein
VRKPRPDDQYSEAEAQKRFEDALHGALITPAKPLKEKPKVRKPKKKKPGKARAKH